MQLVLSNTQGELSPLEIGMHALKAVPTAQGRAGGGLSAYAERIGWTGEYVGQLRRAVDVISSLPNSSLEVKDKAKHLYEISRSDRGLWPLLVEYLVKKSWTVAETKAVVDKVRQFDVPDGCAAWLPLPDVVAAFLKNDRFNPATVTRLVQGATAVADLIEDEGTDDDTVPDPADSTGKKRLPAPGSRTAEIIELLAVSVRSVQEWTKDARQSEKERQQAAVWDLWLECNAAPEIAVALGFVDKDADMDERNSKSKVVRDWIKQFRESAEMFEPLSQVTKDPKQPGFWGNVQHFDVWSFATSAGDAGTGSYFGKLPPQVVENLPWLYTNPGDIVSDGAPICAPTRPARTWVASPFSVSWHETGAPVRARTGRTVIGETHSVGMEFGPRVRGSDSHRQ